MKMTYVDALTTVIDTLNTMDKTEQLSAALEKMEALRTTYQKRAEAAHTPVSEEKRAAQNAARKAANAAARAELMAQVVPALRAVIDHDMTAKEIYEAARENLPADFTDKKVQYILLHEMADEVEKTETKGHANTYKMKG